MSDSVGIVIQARLGSSRLPRKVLRPFYKGKSILAIIIDRLKCSCNYKILVATTSNDIDKEIVELCEKEAVSVFCGSENDVLSRFVGAAEAYNIDIIGRVCSDNPFFDCDSLNMAINTFIENSSDYVSFLVNGVPSMKTHYGFWGEVVSAKVLRELNSRVIDSSYREHVTNYIYTHPDEFDIKYIIPSNEITKLKVRLTIDTFNDFTNASRVYEDVIEENGVIDIDNVARYLLGNQAVLSDMLKEIERNAK